MIRERIEYKTKKKVVLVSPVHSLSDLPDVTWFTVVFFSGKAMDARICIALSECSTDVDPTPTCQTWFTSVFSGRAMDAEICIAPSKHYLLTHLYKQFHILSVRNKERRSHHLS
ncbi:hypothetical protein AAC387_Pa07g2456 [Persea americana]